MCPPDAKGGAVAVGLVVTSTPLPTVVVRCRWVAMPGGEGLNFYLWQGPAPRADCAGRGALAPAPSMLVPFLIMLRQGIEAALIVGIIASFLRHSGRAALMPAVWAGVFLALGLSLLAGAGLQWMAADFPQKQQELFEGVVGLVAVAMLTGMVFWMRKASRSIKGELQASEKLMQAAQMLSKEPGAMQLRYMQTLGTIAGDKSSTIVFPLPVDLLKGLVDKQK